MKNTKMFFTTITTIYTVLASACSGDLRKIGIPGVNVAASPVSQAASPSTTIAPVQNTVTPTPAPDASASVQPSTQPSPTATPVWTRGFKLSAPKGTTVFVGDTPYAEAEILRQQFVDGENLSLFVQWTSNASASYVITKNSPKFLGISHTPVTAEMTGSALVLKVWIQGSEFFQTTDAATLSYTVMVRPTPTPVPTNTPSPAITPTTVPTSAPTASPTITPTTVPTSAPTASPTITPTTVPTATPSASPGTNISFFMLFVDTTKA